LHACMCCRVKIFTHPLDPLPASLMHYIYLFHDNLQWCATGPRRRRYSATGFAFNYLQVFAFKYLQVLSKVLHMDYTLGLKEMFPNKFSLCLRTSLSLSHSRSRSRALTLALDLDLSLSRARSLSPSLTLKQYKHITSDRVQSRVAQQDRDHQSQGLGHHLSRVAKLLSRWRASDT
jgi:hypothetical protein